MLTLEEMFKKKKLLGYSNQDIAVMSGVPLGTVQKIFSGATKRPRLQTMIMLDDLLSKDRQSLQSVLVTGSSGDYFYIPRTEEMQIHETVLAYDAAYEEDLPLQTPRKQGEFTVNDYLALPDDRRVELIDGIIYDMGAPGTWHQSLIGAVFNQFYNFLLEHEEMDCEILLSPVDVQLDEDDRTMVQPDLVGLCYKGPEDPRHIDHRRIFGAPDFVAEILSPSSASRDCVLKLRKYQAAGCGEYWIVDPERERVTVYRFRDTPFSGVPIQYTFRDQIPVATSGDLLVIDFAAIRRQLRRYYD